MKKISVIFAVMFFVFSNLSAMTVTNDDISNLGKQKTELEQKRIEIEQKKQDLEQQMKAKIEAKRLEAEKVRNELETKKKELETKKTEYKTKKEEYLAFKSILNSKKEDLKSNRDENLRIININKGLRDSIKLEITRIKTSNIILNQSVIDTIKIKNDEIKGVINDIASTNGKITSLLNQNKDLIKNKDYAQMEIVYSQIDEIQKTRNDNLVYVNTILTDILNILKDIK